MIYEIHLAADVVSDATKSMFLELGFKSNKFIRHREVSDSSWRATFKSDRPRTNHEWSYLCEQLNSSNFQGTLIEERFDPSMLTVFKPVPRAEPAPNIPSLPVTFVPDGEQKACDIHITLDLKRTCKEAVSAIDQFCKSSVDREPENTKRIYTITCEDLDDGISVLNTLNKYLSRIPNLAGKAYIEEIINYERIPPYAPVLNRLSHKDAVAWLEKASHELAMR